MIVVLFGVAGSGKTTVGDLLARTLGWEFIDADDFHSPENVAKMRSGIPLEDADRAGWLAVLRHEIATRIDRGEDAVLACSALKQAYRDTLAVSSEVVFVYLKTDSRTAAERLAIRTGHFLSPSLLDSQFATLEEPAPETPVFSTEDSSLELVEKVRSVIAKRQRSADTTQSGGS